MLYGLLISGLSAWQVWRCWRSSWSRKTGEGHDQPSVADTMAPLCHRMSLCGLNWPGLCSFLNTITQLQKYKVEGTELFPRHCVPNNWVIVNVVTCTSCTLESVRESVCYRVLLAEFWTTEQTVISEVVSPAWQSVQIVMRIFSRMLNITDITQHAVWLRSVCVCVCEHACVYLNCLVLAYMCVGVYVECN